MIAEFALTIMLYCGQPVMGFMWGGEVEPERFPVDLNQENGNLRVPTDLAEKFAYVVGHPDVEVTHIETTQESTRHFVCAEKIDA
jgi:hypothetical protein